MKEPLTSVIIICLTLSLITATVLQHNGQRCEEPTIVIEPPEQTTIEIPVEEEPLIVEIAEEPICEKPIVKEHEYFLLEEKKHYRITPDNFTRNSPLTWYDKGLCTANKTGSLTFQQRRADVYEGGPCTWIVDAHSLIPLKASCRSGPWVGVWTYSDLVIKT